MKNGVYALLLVIIGVHVVDAMVVIVSLNLAQFLSGLQGDDPTTNDPEVK